MKRLFVFCLLSMLLISSLPSEIITRTVDPIPLSLSHDLPELPRQPGDNEIVEVTVYQLRQVLWMYENWLVTRGYADAMDSIVNRYEETIPLALNNLTELQESNERLRSEARLYRIITVISVTAALVNMFLGG